MTDPAEPILPALDLPALTPSQKELVVSVPSLAYVVATDRHECDVLVACLEVVGLGHIRVFTSVARASDAWAEAEPAILLARLSGALPFDEELAPVRRQALNRRRDCLVAVVADEVMTLDGDQAFVAQVNCVVAVRDLERLPLYLRRAWLHHLELYRHYRGELEG
jgi:hypothetical protein